MARAFCRFRRRVAENIIFVLLASNLLKSAQQIIGVCDDETAGSARQHVEYFLIARDVWKLRNDAARRGKRILAAQRIASHSSVSSVDIASPSGPATASAR